MNRINLDSAGIDKILRSPEVEAELMRRGRRVVAAAGEGHAVEAWQGFDRVQVSVRTTTHEAALAEAENRTLTKAIDAARG